MSKLSLTSETDEVLYKNFMIGDEMAFTAIYERYERRILTYLKTTMRDQPAAADDLFQETFIRLYRERTLQEKALETGGDYRPIENLKSWLFRVAHNLAMSYLRIGKRTVS
ncbi:MAG: RNA polymerase sigma factor [Chlorobi bacterium]|nr:RNA polymerase sigma factor [Chlorobiota bacterium]